MSLLDRFKTVPVDALVAAKNVGGLVDRLRDDADRDAALRGLAAIKGVRGHLRIEGAVLLPTKGPGLAHELPIALSARSRRVALKRRSAFTTPSVEFYDIDTGEKAAEPKRETVGLAKDFAFSSDGALLAGAYFLPPHRLTATIWSLTESVRPTNIRELHSPPSLLNPTWGVNHINFSPNGRLLALGRADGGMSLFDLETKAVRHLEPNTAELLGVCFSPDGELLAANSYQWPAKKQVLHIWDARSGELIAGLEADAPNAIGSVASDRAAISFSRDNQYLVSGGTFRDSVIRVWNLERKALLRELPGHEPWPIGALVFSPDGAVLLSGGQYYKRPHTIRAWSWQRISSATSSQIEPLDEIGMPGSILRIEFRENARQILAVVAWRRVAVFQLALDP